MNTYLVEGLVKVGAGRWVVWTVHGSYAVKDFGHIEEGMLSFTASIDGDSEAAAIAEFVGGVICEIVSSSHRHHGR